MADRSRDAEDPREHAWRLLDDGDVERGLALAERLLAESPDDADLLLLAGCAAADAGDAALAERHLREALRRDRRSLDARVALTELLFATCRFDEATGLADRLLRDAPEDARVRWLAAHLAERRGDLDAANREERAAHRLDEERFPLPPRLEPDRFEAAVHDAMEALPEAFRARLENLALLIEPVPGTHLLETLEDPEPDLLGLYVGIPATERSVGGLVTAPDAIYLFQRNLERAARDEAELVEEIRTTLLHEIGHYLGMDEDDLADAGYE